MSANDLGFSRNLACDSSLKEADTAVAVAWFLIELSNSGTCSFGEICDFIEKHSIRMKLNRSRLKSALAARKDISVKDPESVSLPLKVRLKYESAYSEYLSPQPIKLIDTILEIGDFEGSRSYVKDIVRQVNACYQFDLYDACAVMMRRLAEILIIDAYETAGARAKILKDGEYHMMHGLIAALKSGDPFKLSRNAPKSLETLKQLGDNAAHSKTYLTKKLDIDDFALKYRQLISELTVLTLYSSTIISPKT